jgi:general stress protein 26
MNIPATTLDTRYSDPAAKAIGWEETRQILESAELFWVTTVRADGRPHVTPVVAAWVDGGICFCTGAGEQKFLNLRANPHVVVTTGCNQWDRGIDVVVEGDAVHVTDEQTLRRLAAAFTKKWDGRWQFEARDGCFADPDSEDSSMVAQVFLVSPVKVFAHKKGDPFGATTHKFWPPAQLRPMRS